MLFEYDPNCAGSVPVRLLAGLKGILQTDGCASYDVVCRENQLVHIGCWDHARHKYMDAVKTVPKTAKSPTKANVALGYTLNHWASLVGYCDHRQVNISNTLAENAIRPFAVGRRAWLFADSSQGASASSGCYFLD